MMDRPSNRPFAITLGVGSSLANKTGAWRTERPVYVDLLPPCNDACPAGENVQRWLYHAEARDYEAAWRQIMADNPFPAIMGRVCYHPCQTACNRATLDTAVGINSVERFLGDEALRQGWTVTVTAPPSGRRVLVVGAGPAGLAAAYHLARLGHDVTVRDAGDEAGGMMRYGIPAYRLPRDVLDLEIARIADMGVKVELNTPVADLDEAVRDGGFDAAFLAIGAQLSKRAYIPAGDSARILDALGVLRDVAGGGAPDLGRRVIVYGGGNTAMDVARTARRLGATDTLVVYRRTREKMPAQPVEVDEANEEGVRMRWLSTIAYADGATVRVERMRLDESGSPQPTGEFEELAADSVVLAIGQDVDRSILDGMEIADGGVRVDPGMMTTRPGVFAGGDAVADERTVTAAVGHGKRAARYIDAWLHGVGYPTPARHDLAAADRLHPWYYSDAPATVRAHLDAVRRVSTFDEVVQGLDEDTALFEARRCLSCGNCFECDNCYGMCPDNAVIKLGPGLKYQIDLDYCKGCGICAAECPSGAITMVPEQT
jgi:2-oxoacid:acceptor oxidoreductase delta subunit (pyruvate/2-ketoisovalerate family)